MSNEAINWAWQVTGLQPVERLLLVAIADYADEVWSSYPGQRLLAERACCSERTVRERLKSMEDRGIFTRDRRYSDGLRTSDRFVLNRGYRQELPVDAYRQIGATLPADSGDLTGMQLPGNHQNPKNHQLTPISPLGGSADERVLGARVVEDAFAAFWSCYPRRVGKPVAEKAFVRAVKRAGGTTPVLDGARRLRDDPNLPEKQFVPHPSTWLNRDGWEDEALPARAGGVLSAGRGADAILAEREAAPDWRELEE